MSSRSLIVLALAAAFVSLPLAFSARRVSAARQQVEASRTALMVVAADAKRVSELRSMAERVARQKRPDQDVIARINAVLDAVDVPRTRLGGLRTATDAPLAGSAQGDLSYNEQTLRVSLRRLTSTQLGAFLAEWSETQDLWTPTSIELSHVRGRDDPPLYDVTILITAIYIAD